MPFKNSLTQFCSVSSSFIKNIPNISSLCSRKNLASFYLFNNKSLIYLKVIEKEEFMTKPVAFKFPNAEIL